MRDKTIYVLDAAALFSAYQLLLPPNAIAVTTHHVIEEVKDEDSRRALEVSLAAGKLTIVEPTEDLIKDAIKLVKDLGELSKLSEADISIIAIIIKYIKNSTPVIVVTDDYSIQNVAKHLGANILGIKRKTITKTIKYITICPICGHISHNNYCPLCGSKTIRKPTT